ncbi:unnamed protein product [Urochloa humidicola]
MGRLSRLLTRAGVLWRGPSSPFPTSAPRAGARLAPMPNRPETHRAVSPPGAWSRLVERTRVLWRGPTPTLAPEASSGLLRRQRIRGGGFRRSQVRRLQVRVQDTQKILKEVKDIQEKLDDMSSKNMLKWVEEGILSILFCTSEKVVR